MNDDTNLDKPAGFQIGEWMDLTNESFREYVFPHGILRIDNPVKVIVKRKPEGDSHRVIAAAEDGTPVSYYVPAGWLAIRWYGLDGQAAYNW